MQFFKNLVHLGELIDGIEKITWQMLVQLILNLSDRCLRVLFKTLLEFPWNLGILGHFDLWNKDPSKVKTKQLLVHKEAE